MYENLYFKGFSVLLISKIIMWNSHIIHIFQLFKTLWKNYQQVFHKMKNVEKCGKLNRKLYFRRVLYITIVECGKLLIF